MHFLTKSSKKIICYLQEIFQYTWTQNKYERLTYQNYRPINILIDFIKRITNPPQNISKMSRHTFCLQILSINLNNFSAIFFYKYHTKINLSITKISSYTLISCLHKIFCHFVKSFCEKRPSPFSVSFVYFFLLVACQRFICRKNL